MADLTLEATVNGRRVVRQAKPSQRALDFLRDDLHMTGTKEGCGAGECGTCSIFKSEATVNGRRVVRQAKPSQRALDFLRDDLHMTGTKEGCGAGECGTCSIF